jgi:hypothetical protein
MDIRKEKYLSNKSYIAKVTTIPSEQEKILFSKYYEPIIEVGGSMTNGDVSFDLTEQERSVYTHSPLSQTFDTVSLGIDYEEAGIRADIFIDTIINRIDDELNTLRNTDSTSNTEFNKVITI